MKITKRQLRTIVQEAMDFSDREANPHDGGMHGKDIEDRTWDEGEYDRGYQDGFDEVPPASNATTGYDTGYEDGAHDASMDDDKDEYRGFHEGVEVKDMPESWQQALGGCLEENK